MASTDLPLRLGGWLRRWSSILPLLAAEFVLWTGFGALLPVMPLYFTEQGVAVSLLGVVIAAWPAARLFAEPVFGNLADRVPRLPQMVIGLLVAAVSVGAMAIWAGPVAFIVLRALSGLGTAMYDPAARGYLTDAAPVDGRGEVFGMYNAAQMGGILLGPAIGGLGTALVGGYVFVLVFCSITTFAAAIAVAVRVRDVRGPRRTHELVGAAPSYAEFPGEPGPGAGPAALRSGEAALRLAGAPTAPASLRNRFILTAILVNLAGYFGGGLYETIWGLFVVHHGGGVELVGATFAVFGLTTILVSPFGGRVVDRRGPYPFVVGGLLVMAVMMFIYPWIRLPILYVPLVAIEAIGFSFLGPATYAVIARGTPDGRSSTAQGVLGAAGTVGTIAAALGTGILAAVDLSAPFFAGSAVVVVLLAVILAVDGGALRSMRPAAA
jgi:DHA1 family multidrug resistance protein-like MFS transporter